MKDKKFLVLVALFAVWLALFLGTVAGEVKLNPNVERFLGVILLLWGLYWTISALGWVKKSDSTEENNGEKPADTCSCGNSHNEPKTNGPKTEKSTKS